MHLPKDAIKCTFITGWRIYLQVTEDLDENVHMCTLLPNHDIC